MASDVVTFGEAMIRLSAPNHERLEQTASLQVHVGGSEMNVAVAAARLGLRVDYVTRLTRNPLGQMVENKAREHGVETSHIVWTDTGRVGTYYVEFGAAPRANAVVYDRRHSAISEVQPGEIAWDRAFEGARVFHTSGITPALSPQAASATIEAVKLAKKEGLKVSIDLNYRARLWTQQHAREVMTEIVEMSDILITTEEDTLRVFGIEESSYELVARKLARQFGLEAVAITLRKNPTVWRNQWTAIAYDAVKDSVYGAPEFDIEVVDRIGSGDAFVGGFLYGYLAEGTALGVRYGVAISAIKQTHPGDLCWATLGEVESVLDGGTLRIAR